MAIQQIGEGNYNRVCANMERLFGKINMDGIRAGFQGWQGLALEIRGRLGSKGYLLDRYLSALFSAFAHVRAHQVADDVFDDKDELRIVLSDILDGNVTETTRSYALYPMASALVKNTPLPYQECSTKLAVYYALLAGEWLKYAHSVFRRERKIGWWETDVKDSRQAVAVLLPDEELLDRLDGILFRCYYVASPSEAFLQGMNLQLFEQLLHRDAESCKQVFQILLDRGAWE